MIAIHKILFSLFLATALLFPSAARAATALGMTAEEMQELYGNSFVKQVKESETALQQLEEMNAESTVGDSTAADDAPAEPAADDETKGQKKDAGENEERNRKRERAMLMGNVEILIKTKRTVDAKIERSRKEIANMRRKMVYIDSNLRKRREREKKRYERDLETYRRNNNYGNYNNYNNNFSESSSVRPMRDIDLSTIDRNTVTNSQKRIAQYKTAIPQLIAFSQELTTNIDTSTKKLGSVKSSIINTYEASVPEAKGAEEEANEYDTKDTGSFGR